MQPSTRLRGMFKEDRRVRLAVLASVLSLVGPSMGCSDPQTGSGGMGGGNGSGAAGTSTTGGGGGAGGNNAAGGSIASGGGGAAGAPVTAAGGGTGGTGAIDASFDTFKSLVPTHCFGGLCHDLPENPLKLTVDDKLYTTLTTHMTKHCGPVLTPGNPQDSALVKLLKGPCGETNRMPFGKCFEDGDEGCVSPEYIAAIEQWIAKGAPQ